MFMRIELATYTCVRAIHFQLHSLYHSVIYARDHHVIQCQRHRKRNRIGVRVRARLVKKKKTEKEKENRKWKKQMR